MTIEEAIQHAEEVGTMMSRQYGNTQYRYSRKGNSDCS